MTDNAPPDARFHAVLLPHRSLPRWGFKLLIVSLGALLSAIGFTFWSLGAWPVAGFCGLEVLLVWGAFELNYRAGRSQEIVLLDEDVLEITRVDPRGRALVWHFPPGWVRVGTEPVGTDDNRLVLTSHGRRLSIARFLTPEEREDFGRALARALDDWRQPPHTA